MKRKEEKTSCSLWGVYLLIVALFTLFGVICYKYTMLERAVQESRKVYVCNLEEVLNSTNIIAIKQNFNDEMVKLNDELTEGEKKIKSLKNVNVKEDFTDIYMKNLRLKRDGLVVEYDKKIGNLTTKINDVLTSITEEKHIPVIFAPDTVVFTSSDMVDITDEVIQRLKSK